MSLRKKYDGKQPLPSYHFKVICSFICWYLLSAYCLPGTIVCADHIKTRSVATSSPVTGLYPLFPAALLTAGASFQLRLCKQGSKWTNKDTLQLVTCLPAAWLIVARRQQLPSLVLSVRHLPDLGRCLNTAWNVPPSCLPIPALSLLFRQHFYLMLEAPLCTYMIICSQGVLRERGIRLCPFPPSACYIKGGK